MAAKTVDCIEFTNWRRRQSIAENFLIGDEDSRSLRIYLLATKTRQSVADNLLIGGENLKTINITFFTGLIKSYGIC